MGIAFQVKIRANTMYRLVQTYPERWNQYLLQFSQSSFRRVLANEEVSPAGHTSFDVLSPSQSHSSFLVKEETAGGHTWEWSVRLAQGLLVLQPMTACSGS